MNLFIPPLGTKLYLTAPWAFKLTCEYRNRSLWQLQTDTDLSGVPTVHYRHNESLTLTLDPGTELIVSRIFIRKGSPGYNSVTFTGKVSKWGVTRTVRFWVSLDDANNIKCKVIK